MRVDITLSVGTFVWTRSHYQISVAGFLDFVLLSSLKGGLKVSRASTAARLACGLIWGVVFEDGPSYQSPLVPLTLAVTRMRSIASYLPL
jgi:hypothetical protein